MYNILGVVFIVSFFVLVIGTVILKSLGGTNILVLGKKDKRELLFGLGYFLLLYIILANAITLPMPHIINRFFWDIEVIRIIGVIFCCLGTVGYIICTFNFWQSVRIGVDYENAGKLTTTGIYAISRNPMYMSFLLLFFGEFLIFPNIGLLASCIVAGASFHMQIIKEELFLKSHYGKDYENYCEKVRRYL
jgi:protein-S-isoprenylcysteine O-methyltransferase Ste14